MRLWLPSDAERRPDPAPAQVDERPPFIVGAALWLVALVVLIAFAEQLDAAGRGWWIVAAAIGLGLGVAGFVYAVLRRR